MAERIQKLLAQAGLMSRREADEALLKGRISLNGRLALPGDRAEPGDEIRLDGEIIPGLEEKEYFLLNKPRGYVCTLHDEKGRRSVRELLPPDAGRVYPVGRLDIMSEGLLLMTNDGDFAFRMLHPSCGRHKTYRLRVSGDNCVEGVRRLSEPFELDGTSVQAVDLKLLQPPSREKKTALLDITIREGKNREIRRMCEQAGLHVERLIRIREGSFELGSLPKGAWRRLTAEEIASVLEAKEDEN